MIIIKAETEPDDIGTPILGFKAKKSPVLPLPSSKSGQQFFICWRREVEDRSQSSMYKCLCFGNVATL